jgi:hypothetical protein
MIWVPNGLEYLSILTNIYCFFMQPHLVLGLISQIIKVNIELSFYFRHNLLLNTSFIILKVVCAYCQIRLLADLNLKKIPQLVLQHLFNSIELLCFPCSTMMVTHVGSVQDGEAYASLLKALAPEHSPAHRSHRRCRG